MGYAITLGIMTVLVTGAAFICALGHHVAVHGELPFRSFIRKTFAPITAREFLFPPCPFCWLARAGLIGTAVLGYHAVV